MHFCDSSCNAVIVLGTLLWHPPLAIYKITLSQIVIVSIALSRCERTLLTEFVLLPYSFVSSVRSLYLEIIRLILQAIAPQGSSSRCFEIQHCVTIICRSHRLQSLLTLKAVVVLDWSNSIEINSTAGGSRFQNSLKHIYVSKANQLVCSMSKCCIQNPNRMIPFVCSHFVSLPLQ